jgi:hypothetical protein
LLSEGEKLLWQGRPERVSFAINCLPFTCLGIIVALLGSFLAYASGIDPKIKFEMQLVGLFLGSVIAFVGCALVASPLFAWFLHKKFRYALTDQRLMIEATVLDGFVTTTEFSKDVKPEEIRTVQLRRGIAGIFRPTASIDCLMGRRDKDAGEIRNTLYAISNANGAAQLIRDAMAKKKTAVQRQPVSAEQI